MAQDPSPVEMSSELHETRLLLAALRRQVGQVIRGQSGVIEQMLITLLCGGHALLEGVPGVAKTLMVRVLAQSLSGRARRIQFTPDLMPSDIVGTNVFNMASSDFKFHPGPIFTDLLLADEINRAPAKTQSALLEAMSERHATIDGHRHSLSPVFTVFATQNPIEFEGTYPLPEAQQDRFMLKIKVGYPDQDSERAILDAVHRGEPPDGFETLPAVMSLTELQQLQATLKDVRVEPGLCDYIVKLVRATREHESILVGAGPRGSIFLLQAAKARALLQGRDFLTPDDVVAMAAPVLGHRMTLTAEAEISGMSREEVLEKVLSQIEVPR